MVDFYFWLGRDGEMESLTPDEFKEKQRKETERKRRWKDVDVLTDGEDSGGE